MKALEVARAEKLIGKSLDAKVSIYTTDDEAMKVLESFGEDELETIFIVSGVELFKGEPVDGAFVDCTRLSGVKVEAADGIRCDRCWKYTTDAVEDGDSHLCHRCHSVVEG